MDTDTSLLWSVSAARAANTCPRRWWLRSVPRVRDTDPEPSATRGTLMHAGLAAGYSEIVRLTARWPRPGLGEVQRRAGAASDAAILAVADEHGVADEVVDEAADTAARALAHLGPEPSDEVLAVERTLLLQVPRRGRVVSIVVRPDVVYRRRGWLRVRDWKSTRELPRARDLGRDDQLLIGALAAAREFADTSVQVEIASIGSAAAVSAPVTRQAAWAAAERLAEQAVSVRTGRVFTPRSGPACQTCPVRRHCPVFAEVGPIPVPDVSGEPTWVDLPVRSQG